ncbi:hypothetical protein DFR42_108150 [Undibacterium pigrum]|uniref:Uncharacterized protein n=1 Tax=Undibacterium pigrum TaxID=401470 RepID=A0A318IYE0_9BURK|nr:hypothetical protein DFR42_108150 [Undibacterium pigrum]
MRSQVIDDCRSGVARQLHSFLVSPRKECKRRRPRRRCPLMGVPFAARQKMGRLENSLRSNIDPSFSIFCLAAKASTHGNCKSQKQRQHQRQHHLLSYSLGWWRIKVPESHKKTRQSIRRVFLLQQLISLKLRSHFRNTLTKQFRRFQITWQWAFFW